MNTYMNAQSRKSHVLHGRDLWQFYSSLPHRSVIRSHVLCQGAAAHCLVPSHEAAGAEHTEPALADGHLRDWPLLADFRASQMSG